MKISSLHSIYVRDKGLRSGNNLNNINFGSGKALFAGSFDPFTLGHRDLVEKAADIYDEGVTVLVAKNPQKKGFLPIEKRIELIKESVKDLKTVSVDAYSGLTVDYAEKNGIKYIIRGLRTVFDFSSEMQMLQINQKLKPNITTVFLASTSENSLISSSVVRELMANNSQEFIKFVPKPVAEYLLTIMKGLK